MKKLFIFFFLMFISTNLFSQFDGYRIVDLSYTFDDSTIFWPTEKGFQLEEQFHGKTDKGYFYSSNKFCTAEHGGTHIDAPIHFYKDRQSVDEIPLDNLMGDAVVVDVSDTCEKNRDYQIMVEDFWKWEKENGKMLGKSIVLLKTGFGKFWPDRIKYMGTDERGTEGVAKLHFPGLHPEAAAWLVEERNIKAVGIESPSIDYGQSKYFETHVYLTKHNIPIFENVGYFDELPVKDFMVIALPMKIKGGSGGPARIIALVKD